MCDLFIDAYPHLWRLHVISRLMHSNPLEVMYDLWKRIHTYPLDMVCGVWDDT
jgi:hypothetical protein